MRGGVLGVQMTGILLDYVGGPALAEDFGRTEIDAPFSFQLRQSLGGPGVRQQHRVAQVASRAGIGQRGGDENAVVDLQPVLVALMAGGFGRHLRARGCQSRDQRRGVIYELLDADEARAVVREPVVDRLDMGAQEPGARFARHLFDPLCRLCLLRVARRLRGQPRKQGGTRLPEARIAGAVAGKVAGVARSRSVPRRDCIGSDSGALQGFGFLNRCLTKGCRQICSFVPW